jgi:hypothetical protein
LKIFSFIWLSVLKYFKFTLLTFLLSSFVNYAQTDTVPVVSNKPEKSITIGLKGSVPTGPWRTRAAYGIGGNLEFEWKVSKKLSWFVQGGFYYITGKSFTSGVTTYKTYFNDGELAIGIKLHFPKKYFILMGASINSYAFKTDAIINYSTGGNYTSTSTQQTEKYGLILGGGYTYYFSENMGVEGTATYNYLGDESSTLGITIGFQLKFY